MDLINSIFTLNKMFQIGAIVFSFLFVVLTIQMYANVREVVRTVVTSRNHMFVLVTAILIAISVLLFILGFVIL